MPGIVSSSRGSIHNPYAVQRLVSKETTAVSQVREVGTRTVTVTVPNRLITPEQRRRMQANKEHALMLSKDTSMKRRATVDASDGSFNENSFVTPDKKRNRVLESPDKPLHSTVTPEQWERSQANRQRALQLRQEKERRDRLPVLCPRCSKPSDNQQLCIVWRHRVQHMEEHPSRSIVCWPCCQRVDPQPCFIGTHIPPGTAAGASLLWTTSTIHCDCGELARFQRCHKAGNNQGRYFYHCWVPFGSPQCDYFQWADQVHGLEYRSTLAPDGVSEWQHLHADPFDEDLCRRPLAVVRQDRTRERLIAACLVKQMVLEANSGEFLQCLQTKEELRHAVNQVLSNGNAAVLEHLSPLTGTQIQQRLGYDGGNIGVKDSVLPEEFKALVDKLLETNQVLRATVRRIDSAWLDLQYLGNYFKI